MPSLEEERLAGRWGDGRGMRDCLGAREGVSPSRTDADPRAEPNDPSDAIDPNDEFALSGVVSENAEVSEESEVSLPSCGYRLSSLFGELVMGMNDFELRSRNLLAMLGVWQ